MPNPLKWPPDAYARTFAKLLAQQIAQQNDCVHTENLPNAHKASDGQKTKKPQEYTAQELLDIYAHSLRNPVLKGYTIHVYRGDKTPSNHMQSFLNLTKSNMKRYYDECNFMGGWNDENKLKELKCYRTQLIAIFKHSTEDHGHPNGQETLVGFASFRFATFGKGKNRVRGVYLYELQMAETGKGWGRWLLRYVAAIGARCGAVKMSCTVQNNNSRALDFYTKKCNFVDDEDNVKDPTNQYSILSCDISNVI